MSEKGTKLGYIYGVLSVLIGWQAAALMVDLPIIPSPGLVLNNLLDIFASKIAIHGLYSLWRIVAGLFLAVIIGILSALFVKYLFDFVFPKPLNGDEGEDM